MKNTSPFSSFVIFIFLCHLPEIMVNAGGPAGQGRRVALGRDILETEVSRWTHLLDIESMRVKAEELEEGSSLYINTLELLDVLRRGDSGYNSLTRFRMFSLVFRWRSPLSRTPSRAALHVQFHQQLSVLLLFLRQGFPSLQLFQVLAIDEFA